MMIMERKRTRKESEEKLAQVVGRLSQGSETGIGNEYMVNIQYK